MSANESKAVPKHYTAKTMHWDYVLGALDGRYLEGNITKYVTRHRKKNGLQDLQKALHYLDKLVEEFTVNRLKPLDYVRGGFDMAAFVAENGLNTYEAWICKRLAYWYRADHLEAVRKDIQRLIAMAQEKDQLDQATKIGVPRALWTEHTGEDTGIPASSYVKQG